MKRIGSIFLVLSLLVLFETVCFAEDLQNVPQAGDEEGITFIGEKEIEVAADREEVLDDSVKIKVFGPITDQNPFGGDYTWNYGVTVTNISADQISFSMEGFLTDGSKSYFAPYQSARRTAILAPGETSGFAFTLSADAKPGQVDFSYTHEISDSKEESVSSNLSVVKSTICFDEYFISVENSGSETVENVLAEMLFFDKNGLFFGSTDESIRRIQPGETVSVGLLLPHQIDTDYSKSIGEIGTCYGYFCQQ